MLAYVRLYTPATKSRIRNLLLDYLRPFGIEFSLDYLLQCLDELIKNGLKANYKYCLIRENIETALTEAGRSPRITEVLQNRVEFNAHAHLYGELESTSAIVRKALSQEGKLIRIRMQATTEQRGMNEAEIDQLRSARELIRLRKLTRKYGVKVHIRFEVFGDSLEIEVINDAPILDADLKRIHEKRKKFSELREAGDELMFFTELIDESESGAGLGYATIDAALRNLNQNPMSALNILSVKNTAITLSLNLKAFSPVALPATGQVTTGQTLTEAL